MSPGVPSRASKNQKPTLSKTLSNLKFLNVFGIQRPPKPEEAQGISQETPKDLQDLIKEGFEKRDPPNKQVWKLFWSTVEARCCFKRVPKNMITLAKLVFIFHLGSAM